MLRFLTTDSFIFSDCYLSCEEFQQQFFWLDDELYFTYRISSILKKGSRGDLAKTPGIKILLCGF